MSVRRRLAWGGAAVFALIAAAHTGLWWWTVREIEAGVPSFVGQASTAGWRVTAERSVRGGWPFAATVRLMGVQATRPFGAATMQATAEEIDVSVAAEDLRAVHVAAVGRLTAAIGSGAPLVLQARAAVARIAFEGGPATLAAEDVTVWEPGGAAIRMAHLGARVEGTTTDATADGILLEPRLPPPFDQGGAVSLRVAVSPPPPEAPTPGDAARAWQAEGGVVRFEALAVRWGPLEITGTAEGGLDAGLQPSGRGEMRVRGAVPVLTAAAEAGLVAPQGARAASAVVGLLSMAAGGGPVRLPFVLSDGTLVVAQFPVLRVPHLDWETR